MTDDQIVEALQALGTPRRMQVARVLAEHGPQTHAEISARLVGAVPRESLYAHLAKLCVGGVVEMTLAMPAVYRINTRVMSHLADLFSTWTAVWEEDPHATDPLT